MGDTLLAVNTLLMQLFTLFSYFCDGFALAGEALVGKYYGKETIANASEESMPLSSQVRKVISLLFRWGWGVTVLFSLLYIIGGESVLRMLTDEQQIIAAARPYLGWAAAIPVCGMAAFLWDGIYCGLTATRKMFFSLLLGAVVFFVLRWALTLVLSDANDALWLAFLLYLVVRGLYLWAMAR